MNAELSQEAGRALFYLRAHGVLKPEQDRAFVAAVEKAADRDALPEWAKALLVKAQVLRDAS